MAITFLIESNVIHSILLYQSNEAPPRPIWYSSWPQIYSTCNQIPAGLYQKGIRVSSFTSPHYLWRSLGLFSLYLVHNSGRKTATFVFIHPRDKVKTQSVSGLYTRADPVIRSTYAPSIEYNYPVLRYIAPVLPVFNKTQNQKYLNLSSLVRVE